MELTKAEQIKLGSFKEQLASLKTELGVVNRELESALSARNHAQRLFEQESLYYKKELETANKELFDSIDQKQKTEIYIDNEKLSLQILKSIAEKEHAERIQEADDRIKWSEFKLAELEEEYKKLDIDCTSLLDKQSRLIVASLRHEKEKQKLSKEEKELSALIKQKKTELDELNRNIERKIDIFKKNEAESLGRLKELQNQVEVEKAKIEQPMKTLRQEQEKFAQWEKNVRIIYLRTKKAWEILNPGQNLDNVIKV